MYPEALSKPLGTARAFKPALRLSAWLRRRAAGVDGSSGETRRSRDVLGSAPGALEAQLAEAKATQKHTGAARVSVSASITGILLTAAIAGWPLGYAPALAAAGLSVLRYALPGKHLKGEALRARIDFVLLLIIAWGQFHWLAMLLLADIFWRIVMSNIQHDDRAEPRVPPSPLFPYPLF